MGDSNNIVDVLNKDSIFHSKIQVGNAVQLYLSGKKRSEIRGAHYPHYIIFDTPLEDGNPITYTKNKDVTVRFLHDGIVYGFNSIIIKQYSNPPILIVRYPKTATILNLRKSKRVKLLLAATLEVEGISEGFKGTLLDISSSGCMIAGEIPVPLKVNEKIYISLELPNKEIINALSCTIVRIDVLDRKRFFGLRFDEIDKKTYNALKSFAIFCQNIFSKEEVKQIAKREDEHCVYQIGKPVLLKIQDNTVKTTFRGWLETRGKGYMLVSAPNGNDLTTMPEINSEIYVRSTAGGKVYTFSTQFMSNLSNNLWKLEFIVGAVKHSIRKDERFTCLMPLTISTLDEKEHVKGLIRDISYSGIGFITKKMLPVQEGDEVLLTFILSGFGDIKNLPFRIIRARKGEKRYEYAGAFVDASEDDREKLGEFFRHCQTWALE